MGAPTPMLTPQPPRRRRSQQGVDSRTTKQPNNQTAGHPFGPLLRWAQAAQREALAPAIRGRAQQWPVWMFCSSGPSGCAEERRVWRIRARVCLSDAQRRELSETPPNPSTAGCPVAPAQGTQTVGSPFLWFLSFGDAKERDSPAGRLPASALHQGMPLIRQTALCTEG